MFLTTTPTHQQVYILTAHFWEGSLMHAVFLGPGELPHQEIRRPSQPVLGLSPHVGISFSVKVCSFVLLKDMSHIAPDQWGEGISSFVAEQEGCIQANGPALHTRRDLLTTREISTTEIDLALSFLCKALFHLVLNCVVFSSVTAIHKCSEWKYSDSYYWW